MFAGSSPACLFKSIERYLDAKKDAKKEVFGGRQVRWEMTFRVSM
jgi:hypothetical protein